MTPSASTSGLLSGTPVSEGRLSPRVPSVPGAIFASFMTQAALKPGPETPRIVPPDTTSGQDPLDPRPSTLDTRRIGPADTTSGQDPGARTQGASANTAHSKDEDSETSQVPCWLPNWLAAPGCQPPAGIGAPVSSARLFVPTPEAGDELAGEENPSPAGRPHLDGSSAGVPGLPQPLDSLCAKARPQGTVREPPNPAASKDPNAEPPESAAPARTSPAKLNESQVPQEARDEAPPLSLGSAENPSAPAQLSVHSILPKPADGTGPPAPEATISSQPPEDGMSVAPHAGTMPAPTEVNEISCPEEQKLPGAAVGTVVPPGDERERRAGGAASEADSVMPSGAAQPGLAKPEPPAGQELAVHPVPLSPPVGAVEAVRRAIDDATAGLQGGNGASVSLVLRPDANIQLALHVKLQQGHIEALAVLEHGDFAALGAGWTQLQTRLAEQGVRLAPLVPGSDRSMSSLGGESHGPRQDRQPEHSRPATEDLNKVAATRTGASKSAARNKSFSGQREWWA